MNIIFVLTLVVCLQKFDPSVAVRLRENSNVLVPSNDENLHAKIKTLLNGYEIDPEDFSDNEIEILSKTNNEEVEKLRHKNLDKIVNKVFDDKNKNIEENQIDRDSESLPNESFESIGRPRPPSTMLPELTNGLTSPLPFEFESPTPPPIERNVTVPIYKENHPNCTESCGPSIPPSFPSVAATSLSPSNGSTYASTIGSPTQPDHNSTVSPITSMSLSTANWTATDMPSTPSNWTTTDANSTFYTRDWSNEDSTTDTNPPSNETSSTPQANATTIIDESTTPINSTDNSLLPSGPQFPQTTEVPSYSEDQASDECLLGSTERNLKWVTSEGTLNVTAEFGKRTILDLSKSFNSVCNEPLSRKPEYQSVTFLSAAYNNLTCLPNELLNMSADHLKYLSLAGNNFGNFEDQNFTMLPRLEQLDMRNCSLTVVHQSLLLGLTALEFLYLSYNHIKEIQGTAFPQSLTYLDLSNNSAYNPAVGIIIEVPAIANLTKLQTLDLSFTHINPASVVALEKMSSNLTRLSLCYTQISATPNLTSCARIIELDISGNPLLPLETAFFNSFASSLESLHVKNSNVKNLDWTRNLVNLKYLSLYDNNIHSVTKAFSHMTQLEILDLEKNSIGNWYDRLFNENTVLAVLNLRENKLISLSDDMKTDVSNVKHLALGKNDFECRCDLEKFMHELFEATKAANLTYPLRDISNEVESGDGSGESLEKEADQNRVSFGARSYLRPEYDVISRTYQKYYDMAEQSHQALRSRGYYIDKLHPSDHFVLQSKASESNSFKTILFDYDEKEGNYQCINVTTKQLQKIVELHDFCIEDKISDDETYGSNKSAMFFALSISLPLLIGLSALLMVAYWKWWYIKYFFVICKNSAILTFMDDSDGGNDAIIKRSNDDAVDVYLYDAFVSYCEQNREWVLDEFIPNIEKRESINVCLHERDFMVGCGILENIVSCMDRSRCLVLLVSENFLLSQWCQFEMNLAQHRLLETRRDKLIIVLLEDIPVNKQPKTLKYLMRTKTYIKWPGNGSNNEKQVFWKRLKKAITTTKWENDSYGSFV